MEFLSPSLRICKLIMIPPPTPPGIVRTKTESRAKVHGAESTQYTLAFNITTSKANGGDGDLLSVTMALVPKVFPLGSGTETHPTSWATPILPRPVFSRRERFR